MFQNTFRKDLTATQAPGAGDAPGFLAQLPSCRAEMLAMFCVSEVIFKYKRCLRHAISGDLELNGA